MRCSNEFLLDSRAITTVPAYNVALYCSGTKIENENPAVGVSDSKTSECMVHRMNRCQRLATWNRDKNLCNNRGESDSDAMRNNVAS